MQDAKADLKDLATDEDKIFKEEAPRRSSKRGRGQEELSAQKPRKLEFSAKKPCAGHGATDTPAKSSDEGSSDGSDAEDKDIFAGKYALAGRERPEKRNKVPATAVEEAKPEKASLPSDSEPEEAVDEHPPGSDQEQDYYDPEPFPGVPASVRKQIKLLEPQLLEALPANLQKPPWLHYSVLSCL